MNHADYRMGYAPIATWIADDMPAPRKLAPPRLVRVPVDQEAQAKLDVPPPALQEPKQKLHSGGAVSPNRHEQWAKFRRSEGVVPNRQASPDPDGWIEWAGDDCPIPDAKPGEYEIRHENGFTLVSRLGAKTHNWTHMGLPQDIVAYRLVTPKPKVDADGWIEWKRGGKCPIPNAKGGDFEVRFRDGGVAGGSRDAKNYRWDHIDATGDILAYRLITKT